MSRIRFLVMSRGNRNIFSLAIFLFLFCIYIYIYTKKITCFRWRGKKINVRFSFPLLARWAVFRTVKIVYIIIKCRCVYRDIENVEKKINKKIKLEKYAFLVRITSMTYIPISWEKRKKNNDFRRYRKKTF